MSTVILGDARIELPKLPDESVDLCLTGPPFWREYWETNPELIWFDGSICHLGLEPTVSLYVKHLTDIFDLVKPILHTWFGSCWVVLKDDYIEGSHSKCMIPQRFAIEMIDRGWIFREHIILKNTSILPYDIFFFTKAQQYPFRTQYETMVKDNPSLCGLGLIEGHCRKDGTILDPFTGRGTTALAAAMTGRKFIGIELNEQRREVALQRIRNGH